MGNYLLAVEAVDIYATVLDTNDLSTIRGSSLLLLKVPLAFGGENGALSRHVLQPADQAEAVSLGASRGVWKVTSDLAPAAIEERCRAVLDGAAMPDAADASLFEAAQFMRFVVACVPLEGDDGYLDALAAAQTRMRWNQMAGPNVRHRDEWSAVPHAQGTTGASGVRRGGNPVDLPDSAVCSLNGILPRQDMAENVKGQLNWISRSVSLRRRFGVAEKQAFYSDQLALLQDADAPSDGLAHALRDARDRLPMALHFASISEGGNLDLKENLRDKLALFYADGNGFGALQTAYIRGESTAHGQNQLARQTELDATLRTTRRRFLKALLELVHRDASGAPSDAEREERQALNWRHGGSGREGQVAIETVLRLETLLWGGDEFRFVLPARLGFDALKLFFDMTRGRHTGADSDEWCVGDRRMFHAAGLVFFHHDAPIANIIRLGDGLAEACKRKSRDQDLACISVLESFDQVGNSVEAYLAGRSPVGVAPDELLVDPANIALLVDTAKQLSVLDDGAGRRQLRQVVIALHAGGTEGGSYLAARDRLFALYPNVRGLLAPAMDAMGAHALWLLLEDYWDYLLIAAGGMATAGGTGVAA
ncbi:MAG: hypothetical protein EP335_05790 [Alphaproteobacteria bacterium]|nr:MAG: hypothetical protein EP335_05790 [Alphaproteobacteria bacterium]